MIAEKLSAEQKQEALDVVCQSNTFAKSDRLRNLLKYICDAEIQGRQSALNEYVIGVEALGRPEGYSPAEDSCVRSRIYELRQRLEKYYQSEAPDAELRIDLPKGSYVPRYVRTAPAPEVVPHPVILPPLCPPVASAGTITVRTPWKRYWPLTAAFAAGMLLMYGFTWVRSKSGKAAADVQSKMAAAWTPELEAIWAPFLDPQSPVLISFQSRLFFSAGPSLVVRDSRIDSVAAVETSDPIMRTKALFGLPQIYENRNYTDFGSASACLLLGQLLGGRQPQIVGKRSTDVSWDDLGRHNVIFLGKPHADPDIARLLPKEHFQISGATMHNRQPRENEPAEWKDDGRAWDRSNNWSQKFGLVTLIPGPHEGRWILSLAGSGSEHIWALAQFLTSPEGARQLSEKMRGAQGQMPSSWQAVIRADFKAQSPVKVEYVTHRRLDEATIAAR